MSQNLPSDLTVHAKYDWLAAHNEMVVMYRQESDRAAALLAASFLESKLKARFRDYLVPAKVSTSLFDPYHPLSSGSWM